MIYADTALTSQVEQLVSAESFSPGVGMMMIKEEDVTKTQGGKNKQTSEYKEKHKEKLLSLF